MREVWITGIGLVSALGEGAEANWAALREGRIPPADTTRFAPYAVHPVVPLNWDRQIPKKGDQRQMEPWQRLGVFAAGLALDQAGLKGKVDLLGRTHMIVAAGGGERDLAADCAILADLARDPNPDVLLNKRLNTDIRPTLFLAQLSNLLAGNISIVHGVVGSSRTYMGEEAAGVDAVRIALARAQAGQGEVFLVGGSFNGERPDTMLMYEVAGLIARSAAPVWDRGGMALGSLGAFLVLETAEHAKARGATGIAQLVSVQSGRGPRTGEQPVQQATYQLGALDLDRNETAVVSGASGVAPWTQVEQGWLHTLRMPWRGTATAWGHAMEPSFVANLALAALMVRDGVLPPPLAPCEPESDLAPRAALATSWGHWRGEGLGLVRRI